MKGEVVVIITNDSTYISRAEGTTKRLAVYF